MNIKEESLLVMGNFFKETKWMDRIIEEELMLITPQTKPKILKMCKFG